MEKLETGSLCRFLVTKQTLKANACIKHIHVYVYIHRLETECYLLSRSRNQGIQRDKELDLDFLVVV